MYQYQYGSTVPNEEPEDNIYEKKVDKSKKGEKTNKESKDSHKYNKDNKELSKIKAKSQNDFLTKSQHQYNIKQQGDYKKPKQEGFYNESNVKNLKQQARFPKFSQNVVISQQKLAKMYIQNKGDILKIAFILKQSSIQNLCMMILPIVKNALKSLQGIIKKRKIRRVFLPWNDQQLKEFIYKFFQIMNGELYGYAKKIQLDTFWKIIEMKYDTTITISNQQAGQLYKSILDLHLSVYEELENKTTNFQRHMTWSRQQLKILCRLLLKTDNLQKVSDVMILEFGRLKDKFSPKKIFERIDILIKMSVSKIKHQSITYPGLGEIRKIMRHDFYNINYNQGPRYEKIRKQLVRYFEKDTPPLQETYDVLCKLNKFLNEERIYEKNQISVSNMRNGVVMRRPGQEGERPASYNLSSQGFEIKSQNLSGQHESIQRDMIKREFDPSKNNFISHQNNHSQNNSRQVSFEKSVEIVSSSLKQVHPQLQNLLQMDLESLSSSDDSEKQDINNQEKIDLENNEQQK